MHAQGQEFPYYGKFNPIAEKNTKNLSTTYQHKSFNKLAVYQPYIKYNIFHFVDIWHWFLTPTRSSF